MIPTLIGISLVCFILIQLIPGGPVEEMISRVQEASAMKGGAESSVVFEDHGRETKRGAAWRLK